jgi:hypothetical protein
MGTSFWVADESVINTAKELLGKYHPDVVTANFSVCMKDRASAAEIESGTVAVAKKVAPMFKVLTDDLDFVILIAKPLWDDLSPMEQEAHLDSALCSCTAKIDEDGEFKVDEAGNPIFCLRPFDLQGHSEVLARYGVDAFAEVGSRIKSALSKNKKKQEVEDDDE